MKKLIAMAALALAAVSLATAEIAFGARGAFGWGVGTTLADGWGSIERAKTVSTGGAAFVRLPLGEVLGVQAELGSTEHIIAVDAGDGYTARYATLDFPLLLTWTIPAGERFALMPLVGAKLSVPVAKIIMHDDDGDEVIDIDYDALWSLVVGVSVGSYFNEHIGIVCDLRYDVCTDALYADIADESVELGTSRPLLLSAGILIRF